MKTWTPTDWPFLWVLPEDIFKVPNQAGIGEMLEFDFDCETWLLDDGRSLAISFPNLLADRGVPLDIRLYEKLAYPLFTRLNPWLADYVSLSLRWPATRFWTEVFIPDRETEKNYCMHVSRDDDSYDSITVRVFANQILEQEVVSQLRDFLEGWFVQNGAAAVHGESLGRGTVDLERFTAPKSATSYPKDGFQFILPSYTPVTWPWLDLYLKARRTFSKQLRPSFEFVSVT